MVEESLYSKDWFLKAEQDLRRVENLLGCEDWEGASFHLQQAVEKYLKGYLLSKGWQLKRTHNLVDLLKDALCYDETLENFRTICDKITEYYTIDRYPFFLDFQLSEEEIRNSLAEAKKLVRKLTQS